MEAHAIDSAHVGNNFLSDSQVNNFSPNDSIPVLSWAQGEPFEVFKGHAVYPPLAPPVSQANNTHWYAGSVWPLSTTSQNARTIYVNITVPYFAPKSNEFYYVLLSAFDNAGSYNQLGFADNWGSWGLTYSWTTGAAGNLTFHFSPIAMVLSKGTTYMFSITTQNGNTYFTVYQGSNIVWSLTAPTGGSYLVLQNYYSGYYDYTNYEEIWTISQPGGSPTFNFNFSNNCWTSTNNVINSAGWDTFLGGQPSNVGVVINGNSVFVNNPNVISGITLQPAGASVPINGTNYFQVSYYLNNQLQVALAQSNSLIFTADSGTNIMIQGISSGSNSVEEWVLDAQSISANIPTGSAASFYYYDVISQNTSYSIIGGGSPSPSVLTYNGAPATASSQLNITQNSIFLPQSPQNQTIMMLRNTIVSVSKSVSGMETQEQWVTPTSSWNIPQTNQIPNPVIYYHQYYLTVNSFSGSPLGQGWYNAGNNVTFSASTPASADSGIQYVLTDWIGSGSGSYTGTNISQTVTMNNPITETAVWATQYYLDVSSSYGNPSGQGWYNSGTSATFSVTSPLSGGPDTQYTLNLWSGNGANSYTGNSSINSVTMNNPINETASWQTQYYLTVTSSYGSPAGQGWYDDGSIAYTGLDTGNISGGAGTQYLFSSWNTGGTNYAQSNPIIMNAPQIVTASWTTQYYLTVNNGGYGAISGSGWYNGGSSAQATVSTNSVPGSVGTQHAFSSWTGDASGSDSTSNSITMNLPKTANAAWTTQYQLTFAVTPSGSGSTTPSGNNLWINSGPLSISVTPNSGYSFSQWTTKNGFITFDNPNSVSTMANVNGPDIITASLTLNPTPTPSPTTTPMPALPPASSPSPTSAPSPIPTTTPTSLPTAPTTSSPLTSTTPTTTSSPTPTIQPTEKPEATVPLSLLLYIIAFFGVVTTVAILAVTFNRRKTR